MRPIKIEVCEKLAKKINLFNKITIIVDTDLVTFIVFTGGISIVASASGVDLPVATALSETSLLFSLEKAVTIF